MKECVRNIFASCKYCSDLATCVSFAIHVHYLTPPKKKTKLFAARSTLHKSDVFKRQNKNQRHRVFTHSPSKDPNQMGIIEFWKMPEILRLLNWTQRQQNSVSFSRNKRNLFFLCSSRRIEREPCSLIHSEFMVFYVHTSQFHWMDIWYEWLRTNSPMIFQQPVANKRCVFR